MQHAMAAARQFGSVLHFLHTIRPSEFPFVQDMRPQLDELADRDCKALIGRLNATHKLDDVEHHCWTAEGEVSDVFGNFVRDHKIDLLVLGTRGRNGISKLLLGSIAQQIFHCVYCPVLTVGPLSPGASARLQLKKLLFATDLSAESAAAIPYVLMAANTWHTEVDVVHVCSSADSDCRRQMENFSHRMEALDAGKTQVPIRYQVLSGQPASTVLEFAKQNKEDLIVLGLQSRRALYSGPSLSHAYTIVRQAQCPVLSVRALPASITGRQVH
jgi:nucleotide-binding universal stress UspA family protein